MKNRNQRSVTIKGQSTKSSIEKNAILSRRLLQVKGIELCGNELNRNTSNWYQLRKRAKQRLRNLSSGSIEIVENGYRGHHARHWLQNVDCEHVFRVSIREVALIGAQKVCPFCNYPTIMDHYGSVAALKEHVETLSFGNIELMENNVLRGVDDDYEMACLIHQYRFNIPFSKFLADPTNACFICTFEHK